MFGKTIDHTIARLRTTGDKLAFVGPTLARLTVGLVFIGTGWGKPHSLSDVPLPSGQSGEGGVLGSAGSVTRGTCPCSQPGCLGLRLSSHRRGSLPRRT